jgi:hypothetical protein
VLGQLPSWDEVTAGAVLRRLAPPPPLRFFAEAEAATAASLFDRLLDQDGEPRVPVLAMVDQRLTSNETDGWYYADMPPDREAWHLTLGHLDQDARTRYGRSFADLAVDEQGALVQAVHQVCGHRLLRAPLVVERDRLRRAGLPPGLQEPRCRRPGGLGGARPRRPGPRPVG